MEFRGEYDINVKECLLYFIEKDQNKKKSGRKKKVLKGIEGKSKEEITKTTKKNMRRSSKTKSLY